MIKPYYQDDHVTLYHGDALEIVPQISQKFDVVLLDPPYGKIKGDFDFKWGNQLDMLHDAKDWRDLAAGAMKPNGTLWWFAWSTLAGRIEAMIAEKLNPLAHVCWKTPNPSAQKQSAPALRAPAPEMERILMFENYGADLAALHKIDETRGFIFEPLRAYLDGEREKAGITRAEIDRIWAKERGNKGGMSSHWFSQSQWALPIAENYQWLQRVMNRQGQGENLTKPHETLQKEYTILKREFDELKKEYEKLRRYFQLHPRDQKTDLWEFNCSRNPSGHPTEKPLDLITYMIRISCRRGGSVLDFFGGSGTTGRAAKDLNRKAVLVEMEEAYCEIAANRMLQEVLPL